ncbi:hypothetical protein WJT86_11665 [Microvirga sp. W0021]|uniref:Uncharacterized protein n=1 Tax=Hohaiivirga grylli TaxID=3133970 RepID=A0ABV0BM04_9HYPH
MISGIENAGQWFSLPFHKFLHEGEIEPKAISFCEIPKCSSRLVVGIFSAKGETADRLMQILDNPKRLLTELEARKRKALVALSKNKSAKPVSSQSFITPLVKDGIHGFALSMKRKDGKAEVESTVFGWKKDNVLQIIIVVGTEREIVDKTAIGVLARRNQSAFD